jgi:cell division protein YceG involved in septum cleavage
MDNNVKVLIIVVIILVAILGVAGGFILQGYMSNSNKNITANQTNTSVNNTTTEQTTKTSTQDKTISSSQAISIANKYAARFGEKANGNVEYLSGIGMYNMANGDPFYHVDLEYITPRNYGNSDDILTSSYVEIDAKTGAINPRG